MAKTEDGFLLIADITGYTQYLSETELEHAQGVLAALLELLVAHTRPPLIISRLAGDAVISYGLGGAFLHGQTFVELIEVTYVAFRKAIERLVLNNACGCAACANIGSLDLKFFIHFGRFAVQRIDNHDELVGSEVNRLHRLLKNSVSAQTGIRAYALYTDPAIRQLGLEDICATMTPHTESYEHLGEIQCWVQDMHPVWQQRKQSASVSIPPQRVVLRVETEVAMRPEKVWDYILDPHFRNILMGSSRQENAKLVKGRITSGSVFQCYHGDHQLPQTILEWQPFERFVTQSLMPIPIPSTYGMVEYLLRPTAAGTCLTQVFSKTSGPWLGRVVSDLVLGASSKQGHKDLAAFARAVEADLAQRGGAGQPAEAPGGSDIFRAAGDSLRQAGESDAAPA